MTINLTPEHQKLIEQAIQTGAYDTADDVIEKALELLQCDEICLRDSADSVDAKIERGFAQFKSGEYKSEEEFRRSMEQRKAEWLGDHPH